MGLRVHVIKKHADYGTAEAFNYRYEDFHNFLDAMGCDVTGDEEDRDFECEEGKYKVALDILKAYKKHPKSKKVQEFFEEWGLDESELNDYLEDLGGLDEVIEAMSAFWNQREKGFGYISFSAW